MLRLSLPTASLFLLVISLASFLPAGAVRELVVNGSFEDGDAFGWAVLGGVYAARNPRTGFFSLRLGQRVGSGHNLQVLPAQVSQSFTLPNGSSGQLSVWYLGQTGVQLSSELVITLLDQNGAILAQWSGKMDYNWHQLTYSISPEYSGRPLTLRFFGTGDYLSDYAPKRCGSSICYRVICYPVYVYIDDISVKVT